jgi:hypothetical protein
MRYFQSIGFLCNYLHAQIIGSRYAVRLLRNTEQIFFKHVGLRSMSSLQQSKIFPKYLPSAIGSLSFPSWSVVNQWNISIKSERFYSKGKGDKSKSFKFLLSSLV